MSSDIFERYCNEEEAKNSAKNNKLIPRPNHEEQPKWIGKRGMTDPRRLGKRKNYSHRIEITSKSGTKKWVRPFEVKPDNEPHRYAIPADRLDEFNRRITGIVMKKR